MHNKLPHELLLDSEASLRLADSLLDDLREEPPAPDAELALALRQEAASTDLADLLLQAYGEIGTVLDTLRRSRGILERATVERVQKTQERLRQVSSATEVATIDLLDGVDLALALVDRLDGTDGAPPSATDAAGLRAELRDRLHGLVTLLQFQDITAQQLGYASAVLEDVEGRMSALASLIDPTLVGLDTDDIVDTHVPVRPFDPAASTHHTDARQAVADAIFIDRI